MHGELYVLKKKDETIDEGALFESFDRATAMGIDYVEPTTIAGDYLKKLRDSVTSLDSAVAYLNRVKEEISKAVDELNPYAPLSNQDTAGVRSVRWFFDRMDDLKGDWFAVSYGDGSFSFYRRAELAIMVANQNDFYGRRFRDMVLVAYDYHC